MDGSFQTPEKATDFYNRVHYRKSSDKDHNTNFDAPSQPAGNLATQRLLRSGVIQAKLTISQPDDVHEQEADRITEQVMRMPEPAPQRACAGCESGATPCPACEEKAAIAERKAADHASQAQTDSVSASLVESLGSGRSLDPEARAFFEPRFGADLGHVRVHTDACAAESAHALRAQAYTVGRDVVFSAGQYEPGSNAGRRLLAHELTHVVQQRSASIYSRDLLIAKPGDPAERDANTAPAALEQGQRAALGNIRSTGPVVARQMDFDELGLAPSGSGSTQPASVMCDPENNEGHPLIMRGARRAAVGYAQEKLNIMLGRIFQCMASPVCWNQIPELNKTFIEVEITKLTEFPLVIDCKFGPNTAGATKIFQAFMFGNSKDWDGKIGPKTWDALEVATDPTVPPPIVPPPSPSPPVLPPTPLPSPGGIFL